MKAGRERGVEYKRKAARACVCVGESKSYRMLRMWFVCDNEELELS